jgi:hypothetical protein
MRIVLQYLGPHDLDRAAPAPSRTRPLQDLYGAGRDVQAGHPTRADAAGTTKHWDRRVYREEGSA